MRESKVFIDYFKTNFLIILTPAILFSLIGFYYQYEQRPLIFKSKLYLLSYQKDEIQKAPFLTDNIVYIIRDAHIRGLMGINKNSDILAYKTGPMTINVAVTNFLNEQADKDLSLVDTFIQKNYPIQSIGEEITYSKKTSNWLVSSITFSFGFFLGNLICLIRKYISYF